MASFGCRRARKLFRSTKCNSTFQKINLKHQNTNEKTNKERWWYYRFKQQKQRNLKPMQFPLLNPNQAVDMRAMAQCVTQPLSISLQSFKNGDNRFYHPELPSVTTVLQNTQPASEYFALRNWQKAQISEIGEEGLSKKRQTITKSGKAFHHNIQAYLDNLQQPQLSDAQSGFWQSSSGVLKDITNIVAVESGTVHPELGYAGTLDLVAEYKGVLSVIDWKTSRKRKSKLKDCYSYPLQVVAYAGAVNFDENYPFQVCNAVIIIVYEDGREADVHVLPREACEEYWEKWLHRLAEYKVRVTHHGQLVSVRGWNEDLETPPRAGSSLKQKDKAELKLGARTINSLGVPLHSFARVVKDQDVIPERNFLKLLRELLSFQFMEWKLLKKIRSYLRKLFFRSIQK